MSGSLRSQAFAWLTGVPQVALGNTSESRRSSLWGDALLTTGQGHRTTARQRTRLHVLGTYYVPDPACAPSSQPKGKAMFFLYY